MGLAWIVCTIIGLLVAFALLVLSKAFCNHCSRGIDTLFGP